MFRDTEKALKRLETALLEEEQTSPTGKTAVFTPLDTRKNPASQRNSNTGKHGDAQDSSPAPVRRKDRSIGILFAILLILCVLILGVAAVIAMAYLGILKW